MPRFVADITVFAQVEIEAASPQEARESAARALGVDVNHPEMTVSVPSSNGAPVRLVNVDSSIGMVGQRVEALG